ncbi:hypothetical protein [Halococcoides cellulosivorans]|uniref:hypothetical protein n=1 Tax=Halococcoides cellulosivorans TaxID=1679096 RepID=UPI00131F0757|nr:hypothetical protein [Halococcoides cellulosivorans]
MQYLYENNRKIIFDYEDGRPVWPKDEEINWDLEITDEEIKQEFVSLQQSNLIDRKYPDNNGEYKDERPNNSPGTVKFELTQKGIEIAHQHNQSELNVFSDMTILLLTVGLLTTNIASIVTTEWVEATIIIVTLLGVLIGLVIITSIT